ncbi:MAG TPA: TolC family protein [Bryobacteraceae bacterium]|nr:TolC family protein [Bryobacteraceae bacterium]
MLRIRLHEHCGSKRTRAGRIAVGLVLLAGFVSRLPGQDQTPVRLTLRDAVQLALKQNPQVQIANLTLAQSQEQVIIDRSGLLPQASFQTSEHIQRLNLEAFIGQRFPGVPQHAGPFETFQTGPAFGMNVFDLTLWHRWKAAKLEVGAATQQEHTVREQTAALVVSQYLASLRAAANVQAAQSRVELAQALYDQAHDLQQHGVGTGIDTLRANVQLQNEKQRLISAETQQKTTLFGLSRLLNLDPHRPIELADKVSFFATPTIQVDQSLENAYTSRPELKALAYQEQAVEARKKAASAARLPSVRVDGFWAYLGLSPQSVIPSYQYGVSLNLPLITSGRIAAEVARADLELRKLEQQRQETRNLVALEVKTAVAQLEAARNEVDVANLGVSLAREEVNQARDRFQAGVANNIEVISAQDALARANDNQIVALYRYNQARADLARATGQTENLYAR